MKIGNIVKFQSENFFEGAVQLRWTYERPEHAKHAAKSFVFHGPRYHGANNAKQDGLESSYKLKDTASFLDDLLTSITKGVNGEDRNPYWLVVAGYGSGKSHLAVTCATVLGEPNTVIANDVIQNVIKVDEAIGQQICAKIDKLKKPVLVLSLDGMSGFNLGSALSQAAFAQLKHYKVDTKAISDLSPRFAIASQFVERNFKIREDSFSRHLSGISQTAICEKLASHDEDIYSKVDAIFIEANGSPIPVEGQESSQDLIETLCKVYCAETGPFSSVIILFDEFGRYLEYAAEKPHLAGDAALQQIFQGVQDNSNKICFVGLIQYELKTYLNRFGSVDLRQLQRYITRFDTAEKYYLSTNLETIFASMIGKSESNLESLWKETRATQESQKTWNIMFRSIPSLGRLHLWSDIDRFEKVITRGCWPLHPLATWFLTRQKEIVQSRSALTFIKEAIASVQDETAIVDSHLRQISVSELVLQSMLPEILAAEQATGVVVAETLQMLLVKFEGHLTHHQRLALVGIAIVEKMRVGRHSKPNMDLLLQQATLLSNQLLEEALNALSHDFGAIEWNDELGQYELIADSSTRGQFQQWLRKQLVDLPRNLARDTFILRSKDTGLTHVETDFASEHDISTLEWSYESRFAHSQNFSIILKESFKDWLQGYKPTDMRPKIIYLYLEESVDVSQMRIKVDEHIQHELNTIGCIKAPILVVGIHDTHLRIAENLARLHVFEEQITADDKERFRRFLPEEIARTYTNLKKEVADAVKSRLYWAAGVTDLPQGRLKTVCDAILSDVYPNVMPFPFDGFATKSGNGASDIGELTRALIVDLVNGGWVGDQVPRLVNRAKKLFVMCWKVLTPQGNMVAPQHPLLKEVYESIYNAHKSDSSKTLLETYSMLIAPPYGMNSASAQLLLALLIGLKIPPRRIMQNGQLVSMSEWKKMAFPGTARSISNFIDVSVLKNSQLVFLGEQSIDRWRKALQDWELETNYHKLVAFLREAERMVKVDPPPESLEASFKYLKELKFIPAQAKIIEAQKKLEDMENGFERAVDKEDLYYAVKIGAMLKSQIKEMSAEDVWSDTDITDREILLKKLLQFIQANIGDWILRQSCKNTFEVAKFREDMTKVCSRLRLLSFEKEARILEVQWQKAIAQIERRQSLALMLAQTDEYSKLPAPTQSTLMKELETNVKLAKELILALDNNCKGVLAEDEVAARKRSIHNKSAAFEEMIKAQKEILGGFYELDISSYSDLKDAIVKIERLRTLFVDTRDGQEVSDIALQLEHILNDIDTWKDDSNQFGSERLHLILENNIVNHLSFLTQILEEEEIDPFCDLEKIYKNIAAEYVHIARVRSRTWFSGRQRVYQIYADSQNMEEIERFITELTNLPTYLDEVERESITTIRVKAQEVFQILFQRKKQEQINQWKKKFLLIADRVNILEQHEVQRFLTEISNPPDYFDSDDLSDLKNIKDALLARIDSISLDEIISRIEKLSLGQQLKIFKVLAEKLEK